MQRWEFRTENEYSAGPSVPVAFIEVQCMNVCSCDARACAGMTASVQRACCGGVAGSSQLYVQILSLPGLL